LCEILRGIDLSAGQIEFRFAPSSAIRARVIESPTIAAAINSPRKFAARFGKTILQLRFCRLLFDTIDLSLGLEQEPDVACKFVQRYPDHAIVSTRGETR